MEATTAQFLADSLERAGRVLCHMEALLESSADKESLGDVVAWALHAVSAEVYAVAQVLSDHAKGKLSTPKATITPERLEQIKREFDQAAQVGKQALEQWRSQQPQ